MNDNGEPLVLSSELERALRERDEARQERDEVLDRWRRHEEEP